MQQVGGGNSNNGGMNLAQIIPPPQVHKSDKSQQQEGATSIYGGGNNNRGMNMDQINPSQSINSVKCQQERGKQENLLQQQYIQQQQLQSRQHQFTPQQQQEILMNATSVMGNELGMNPQQQQQHESEQIHMDQLRINRLKEKQRLLQQQIIQQQQLELQLRKQQQVNQQQQQSSTEMQKLHSRLDAVYGETGAFLEPTPIQSGSNNDQRPGERENQNLSPTRGGSSSKKEERRRTPPNTLVRENSLKMESIFEPGNLGAGATSGKKKYDASAMSMSGTSLSVGDLDTECELSAIFDTSMKIGGGNNARGNRSPKLGKAPPENKPGNSGLLGMSVATIGSTGGSTEISFSQGPAYGEKSTSSMSCDGSLSRLFEEG